MVTTQDRFEALVQRTWANATPEGRKYIEASGRQSDLVVAKRREWLGQLGAVIHALDAAGASVEWVHVEVFWIKLHSVLLDLPEQFRTMKELHDEHPDLRGTGVAVMADVFDKIADLNAAFTEDELVAIDFCRHQAAHIRVESYEIRWNVKKAEVKDARTVPLNQRTYTVPEVRQRLGALMTANGYANEEALAVALARRARPLIDAIVRAEAALDDVKI